MVVVTRSCRLTPSSSSSSWRSPPCWGGRRSPPSRAHPRDSGRPTGVTSAARDTRTRTDRPRHRGASPGRLAVGIARQRHRHGAPHDASDVTRGLQGNAGARRRHPLYKDVDVAGGGNRCRDRRHALGLRPRNLGGRATSKHRIQLAGCRLLVGWAGRAHILAHRQRLSVGPRRADGAAGRRLRRRWRHRCHPGVAPSDPARRLPADGGANRRR